MTRSSKCIFWYCLMSAAADKDYWTEGSQIKNDYVFWCGTAAARIRWGQAVQRGLTRQDARICGRRTSAGIGSNAEHVDKDKLGSVTWILGVIWQWMRNWGTSMPLELKDREGGRNTRRPAQVREHQWQGVDPWQQGRKDGGMNDTRCLLLFGGGLLHKILSMKQ